MNEIDLMFSDDLNDETEYLPIIPVNIDDYDVPESADVPDVLPTLTLRNSVLFPGVVIPITLRAGDVPQEKTDRCHHTA